MTTGFQLLLALRTPSLASMTFQELEKIGMNEQRKIGVAPGDMSIQDATPSLCTVRALGRLKFDLACSLLQFLVWLLMHFTVFTSLAQNAPSEKLKKSSRNATCLCVKMTRAFVVL